MSANSSSSGKSVRSKHGRTLAAMPKSTVQISPCCASGTRRVLGFHLVEHRKPFAGRVVAEVDVFALGLEFDYFPAQLAPLVMSQLGEFVDDFGHAHTLFVTLWSAPLQPTSRPAVSISSGARLVENGDAGGEVVCLQLLVNAMNFERGMADKAHGLLLWHAGTGKAGDDTHSGAMKRKMTKALLVKEAMPGPGALVRHVEGRFPSLGFETFKERTEGGNERCLVSFAAFDRERDFVAGEIHVFKRDACFTESASETVRLGEDGMNDRTFCALRVWGSFHQKEMIAWVNSLDDLEMRKSLMWLVKHARGAWPGN